MDIVANAQNNTQIVEAEPMTEDQQQVQTEAQPQVENTQTDTTEVTATTAVDAQTNTVQEAFAQQQQATEEKWSVVVRFFGSLSERRLSKGSR